MHKMELIAYTGFRVDARNDKYQPTIWTIKPHNRKTL